ncbi:MAG: DUF2239 family protein [Caulobacter sp.]|nr:DUF2239 family protein [Caulobacter sp.]
MNDDASYSLFEGQALIASGPMPQVIEAARRALADNASARLLAFNSHSGRQVDLDLRAPSPAPRKAGRPKLGVVPREVTLLPRHWDWLAEQPGGASVTLRKLVEAASRDPAQQRKAAIESAYRFISVMAGNLAGFEEASRTLFKDDCEGFLANTAEWPSDVRNHALRMLGWG